MSELELEVFAADTGTAIKIIGRIDGNSAPVLDSRLKELDLKVGLPVVLDFDDVDFVSSAGLRTLLVLAKRVEAEGGSVVIARLQPEVDEVFEISGFKSIFKHYPSLSAALTENGMSTDLCGGTSEEVPVPEQEGGLGRFVSKILPGRSGN
jgi:anti-anti-sigma factor